MNLVLPSVPAVLTAQAVLAVRPSSRAPVLAVRPCSRCVPARGASLLAARPYSSAGWVGSAVPSAKTKPPGDQMTVSPVNSSANS